MLLVAVIGSVGEGKTTLLARVADRLLADGVRVEGFVAEAGDRDDPTRGATSYDLRFLPSGDRVPYARRGDERFDFLSEGQERARECARGLGPNDVVVLDEFGKREASGEGHFALWPEIIRADPPLVLIAVRRDALPQIEERLGRPFDFKVEARDPKAERALVRLGQGPRDWERIGVYGGASGAIEATLGSALHGTLIPMRGTILSSIQAGMLTSAAEGLDRKERVAWVAVVSSGLKALSPAGSKARPMLAIAAQGSLYALSVRSLGWNRLAAVVGGFLVGAWAMGQGVVLALLFTGGDVTKAYAQVVGWLAKGIGFGAPSFSAVAWGLILLSGLISASVSGVFWGRRREGLGRLVSYATKRPVRIAQGHIWKGALLDLLRPSFWVPLALVAGILFTLDRKWDHVWTLVFRAALVGVLFFAVARAIRPAKIARWLERCGHLGPAAALRRGLGIDERVG